MVTFPANIEKLYDMLAPISAFALKAGTKKEIIKEIELGIEEVLVNVIVHGLRDNPEGIISIDLKLTNSPGLQITITDNGVPFNPSEYVAAVPSRLTYTDVRIGGLGLFLIFKIMDRVEYTRLEGKNILTLEKYL